MKGQTVVQSPISIEGYKPVSEETKSGVVGNDSSIDFYYTANPVNYSIEYYWTGSDTPISSEKRSGHVATRSLGLRPRRLPVTRRSAITSRTSSSAPTSPRTW